MEFAFSPSGEKTAWQVFSAEDSYAKDGFSQVSMLNCLLVGVGSAAGGIARFWASGLIATRFGHTFPWGTLFVNVTGSFLIGLFATLTAPEGRWLVGPSGRSLFMAGFCGGYTTFSSFSLQTLNLAQDNEWLYACGNVLFNVVLCLVAVWVGSILAETVNGIRGA